MTTAKKPDLAPDDEGAKAFSNLLLGWEDGELHTDLSKELQQLNAKLREIAKIRGKSKGELVLSIKLAVDEYDVVSIDTTYKVKAPQPPRRKTTMWLTPGGNLTPANPRQLEMGLRPVPAPSMTDAPETARKTKEV